MRNKVLAIAACLVFALTAHAQCLEITSIFVDACGPTEGENEMVTFEVGATPLNVNDISVTWPNNSFNGWCQNAGTATSTAALNATIISSCGWLMEPAGGVLPAGATVITITSENISLTDNSFEGLADTVYIIYQCAGNTAGHFANTGSGTRTLTFNISNSCVGTESVTYDRALLLGNDGATVNFDAAGNPTYVNNGCNAPVPFFNAGWSFTQEICDDYGTVDLNTLLAGGATTGGTWSGTNVVGSDFNPAGMYGVDSITYTVTGTGACPVVIDSTIVFFVDSNQSVQATQQACDSAFVAGTWYTASTTVVVNTPPADSYGCDSVTTIDLIISNEIIDSTYLAGCGSVTFNGTTYTSSITLRDTLPGGLVSVSACDDIFISEYIEGSSNNKSIEIYNGTGVPVNMANYELRRHTNGNPGISATIPLSGIVADGDVLVVSNNNASAAILAVTDITDGNINHNGNDAYTLFDIANNSIVDIFGNIGCDPGGEWTDLGNGTQDNTLYRQANYTTGVTVDPGNIPCNFPSLNAANWISVDMIDQFGTLGSHTANCAGGTISTCDTIVITEIVILPTIQTTENVHLCAGDSVFLEGNWQTTPGTYIDTFTSGGGSSVDTFYTETFDGVNSWTLNTPTGTNGADNNFWQIDDDEGGVAPGGCGVAGNGNNTLHITSVFFQNGGAAYDAGGFCGILFCPETNMAATSPAISTVGRTNISLSFDFIGNGDGLLDNASVLMSTNGGGAYTVIDPSLKSNICGGGQGEWTNAVYNLPVSAENIPDLRIRFVWTNNDDGIGTDPSIAINDVRLSSQDNSLACDSIVTTTVTVSSTSNNNQTITACDSTVYNGTTYFVSTVLMDTITDSFGCDSVYNNIDITINSSVTVQNPNNPVLICSTDSTQLPDGSFVSAAGTYNTVLTGANTCDSTIVTEVQVENCNCFITTGLTFWAQADSLVTNGGTPVVAGTADNWGNIVNNPDVPSLGTVGGGTRTVIDVDPAFNFNASMDLVSAGFNLGGLDNDVVLDPNQGSMFVVATQAGLSLNFVVGTPSTGVCGGNRCSTGFRGNRSEFGGDNNLFVGATIPGVANVMAMSGNTSGPAQKNSVNGVDAFSAAASTIPVATATVNYTVNLGNWPGFVMTGKIAEALIFDRELSLSEYQRVESYLALKYGVGLAHDYYASDWDGTNGTIQWSIGNGYDNNIAGIGTDNCFGLTQIISHSVAPGAIVTMALTDNGGTFAAPNNFDNDLEFLMWGNNGGTTDFSCSANAPAGYNMLYNREWLVNQVGLVGNTDIAFDITTAGLTGITGDVALVVDTDNDGDYSNEAVIVGTVVGNQLVFSGVDVNSGNTFTLVNNSSITVNVSDSICAGGSYTLPSGLVVTTAGMYTDTLPGVQFCDSIVVTDLMVLPTPTTNINASICAGDSYTLPNGTVVTQAGTYADTTATTSGCDSITQVTLEVVNPQTQTLPGITICENETALIFGNNVNIAGTYSDTIVSTAGCDSIIQNITLMVNTIGFDTAFTTICDGDSLLVGGAFQTTAGLYVDTLSGANGCDFYQFTDLSFEPAPTADAGMDVTINLGEQIILTASGGVSYIWSNEEIGASTEVAPTVTTIYSVEVYGNGSCFDTDSVTVIVIDEDIRLLIPTAFSPNGDGNNEIFEIVNKNDFEDIELRVYNRWGELIHIGLGNNHGWDGRYKSQNQPIAVYTYMIKAKAASTNEMFEEIGTVTLLR